MEKNEFQHQQRILELEENYKNVIINSLNIRNSLLNEYHNIIINMIN